ncbi:MAG: hypothetical protein ACFFB3_12215, partial [Candidatus Hodarchaeota archaeon]
MKKNKLFFASYVLFVLLILFGLGFVLAVGKTTPAGEFVGRSKAKIIPISVLASSPIVATSNAELA